MKNVKLLLYIFFLFQMAGKIQSQSYTLCLGTFSQIPGGNPLSLSNCTYALYPGPVTSTVNSFIISPTVTTVYTITTTGLNASSQLLTSTLTPTVYVGSVSASLTSPTGFSIGCNSASVTVVNINNAQSSPYVGAPISYSMLAPGTPTGNLASGILSANSSYSITTPGSYTFVVRDNIYYCSSYYPINIIANNLPQTAGQISISNTLDCNNPTALAQVVSPNIAYSYLWLPQNVAGTNLTVTSNTAVPASSVAFNQTLVAINPANTCTASTVAAVIQNIFKPIASATTNVPLGFCTPSLILTNVSSSGIPLGLFTATAPVVATQWIGPPPQGSVGLSTTYLAVTSGVYTIVVQDQNNGCVNSGTTSVYVTPTAAFNTTVSGAQVSFAGSNAGVGPMTSFYWNFGDGVTSTIQNPTHLYNSSGSHLVTFKKINSPVCQDSITQSVNVSGIPCLANSGFSLAPTATPQVWYAIPNYPWNVTAAQWSWGDATSSNSLYSSHQYAAAGLYNICLSVTVSCVGSSSTCTSYSVYRVSEAMQIAEIIVKAPDLSTGVTNLTTNNSSQWQVLPNPAKNKISLVSTSLVSEAVEIKIIDFSGKLVFHQLAEKADDALSVDVSSLSEGVYNILISGANTNEVQRLIMAR